MVSINSGSGESMHNLKCISFPTKIAVYGVDNDANFVSNVEGLV